VRVRAPAALLAALAAVVGAGCAGSVDGNEPPEPPTSAELSRFVAETPRPAYWLGPRYRGITVSHIGVNRRGAVGLTYGEWTCDSGCGDSGGISTRRRDVDVLSHFAYGEGIDSKDCWTRVGRAVAALVGCLPEGYPQELLIYTGSLQVTATSLYTADKQDEIPVRTVLRALRPLNAHAPWPLPPPTRLSCAELPRVDRRLRRHMPRVLRPSTPC
jgi:hypothetical protein